jgi:hypothetical protein
MTVSSLPAPAAVSPALRVARLVAWTLVAGLLTAGCGAGGAGGATGSLTGAPTGSSAAATTAPITVAPATASIAVGGQSVSFAASVQGGATAGVGWQVNGVAGGDATVGTISASGQYVSPAVMPSPATVTVTAVSAADGTQSGSATLTLTAIPSIGVAVSPTNTSVAAGSGTQAFVATVTNTANTAVSWQVNGVTGGDATVGTIGADGVYTAPATPPAQPNVTISAVSVADPTRSASASALITSAGSAVTVSVTPSAATAVAGSGTVAFAATVLNAASAAATWQVNGTAGGDSTVGTISSNGLYTAPAAVPTPAAVTVTAVSVADPTRSASASVTVTSPSSVTIAPSGADVQAGIGTQAFTATVINATNTAVTWQVNGLTGGNATVGTISQTGLYTAPADAPSSGTVTVTAALATSPTNFASAKVSIKARIKVTVSPSSATAQAGIGTQTFVANVSNTTNTAVTWQVNGATGGNATVGTISAAGVYKAPASAPSPANVTVTATSVADPTRPGSATLTVTPPVSVSVSPATASVQAGTGTQAMTVAVANTANTGVTWQVNGIAGGNSAVGTISATGLYTAPTSVPSPAAVTVTAVSVADPTRSGAATLTITPPVSVSVTPSSVSVQAGIGTQTFTATVGNTASTGVTWQVNGVTGGNSTVGTISTAGVYKAPASAPSSSAVTITAMSIADPTRSGTATVSITPAVAVSISPSIASVTAGSGSQQFKVVITNGVTGSATWQVNGATGGNSTVGTISTAGLYTAPAKAPSPSTVSVTAVSVDDPSKSASASVSVVAAPTSLTIGGTPATSATVGTAYSFQPTAAGGSGATLTFGIANQPAWATFNSATGLLSGTPGAGAIGTYANISISVSDGTTTATLPAFTLTVLAGATGSATVSWTAPTTRTDGTPLTNLAGFRVYYGTSPGNYPTVITIADPTVSTYVVSNLSTGTYYFVATAYDSTGEESAYSAPGSKTIQ